MPANVSVRVHHCTWIIRIREPDFSEHFGWIEILFVALVAFGFGFYQLWSVNREIARDKEKKEREREIEKQKEESEKIAAQAAKTARKTVMSKVSRELMRNRTAGEYSSYNERLYAEASQRSEAKKETTRGTRRYGAVRYESSSSASCWPNARAWPTSSSPKSGSSHM